MTTSAAQNPHLEVIHHPDYDQSVFMPFVPAVPRQTPGEDLQVRRAMTENGLHVIHARSTR